VETHVWKIDWNDRLSVGIPEINEDHKRFISLVNEFNRSIVDRMDLSEIKKRLQLIIDDAVQHFAHEERLFKEWHYPDVDDHTRKHAEIIATLQTIIKQLKGYNLTPQWIEAVGYWEKFKLFYQDRADGGSRSFHQNYAAS
jgi:hemerythrin